METKTKWNDIELMEMWRRFIAEFEPDGEHGKYDHVLERYAYGDDEDDIRISLQDVAAHDLELFGHAVTHPERHLRLLKEAARERVREMRACDTLGESIYGIVEKYPHVYLVDAPVPIHVDIDHVRSAHVGRLISIEGTVKRIDDIGFRVTEMGYRCGRCENLMRVRQKYTEIQEPLMCQKEEGGCGRAASATRFDHVPAHDISIRTQTIHIEENLESVDPQRQPEQIMCILDGTDCGTVFPGNRVRFTGFLDTAKKKRSTSPIFDLYFRVLGIDLLEQRFADIEVTPDEEREIREMVARPGMFRDLSRLIAPELYGLDEIKEAVLMMLVGAPEFAKSTGEAFRGNLHILLAGDPSTGKSRLLEYIADIMPRGIYASGRGSTAAGLSATVERDEKTGRWYVVGGALVMANDGVLALDEMDKVGKRGMDSLLQGMSSQRIPVDKASIHATLVSKTSVLAAANPKDGRFSSTAELGDQIRMSSEMMSRFDLIYLLRDVPDEEQDAESADHILDYWDAEDSLVLDRGMLVKYLSLARRHSPRIPGPLKRRIRECYTDMRQLYLSTCLMPIDKRHLQGIMRLAMASARARLRDEVEEDDVARAIDMMTRCIRALSPDGEMDVDGVRTGMRGDTRRTMEAVRGMIDRLHDTAEFRGGVPLHEIVAEGVQGGLADRDIIVAVREMMKRSDIYEIGRETYIPMRR